MTEERIDGQLACLRMLCGYVLEKAVHHDAIELQATRARLEQVLPEVAEPLLADRSPDFQGGFHQCLEEFLLSIRESRGFFTRGISA